MDAKKLLYVVPAAAVLLYLVFSPGRYSVGDQVSDFSLGSLDGERISLNDYSGKVVFIEFFSTKCPVAKRAFSHTGELSARFSEESGVVFFSVCRGGDPSAVGDFVDRYGGKRWPILLDREREVYDRFFDKGVPAFVVIDTSGHLAFKERGWWSSDREAVNLLARELERAGARA